MVKQNKSDLWIIKIIQRQKLCSQLYDVSNHKMIDNCVKHSFPECNKMSFKNNPKKKIQYNELPVNLFIHSTLFLWLLNEACVKRLTKEFLHNRFRFCWKLRTQLRLYKLLFAICYLLSFPYMEKKNKIQHKYSKWSSEYCQILYI